jgi:hypothetical protein
MKGVRWDGRRGERMEMSEEVRRGWRRCRKGTLDGNKTRQKLRARAAKERERRGWRAPVVGQGKIRDNRALAKQLPVKSPLSIVYLLITYSCYY